MGKLNQVVAVVAAKKKLALEVITGAYHTLQKVELFQGLNRTYTPRDDEGERFPAESKIAQASVKALLQTVTPPLIEMFDTVLTQDEANTAAKSGLCVDGIEIIGKLPVTYLLFLEKQLNDLTTFVSKLPVLDPSEEWHWDEQSNMYASAPSESIKTKKLPKAFIKAEATDKHPAQVEVFTEDVLVGYWKAIKFSGALKASDKAAMLERVRKLRESVVKSREACNSIDVTEQRVGERILNFVFKGE